MSMVIIGFYSESFFQWQILWKVSGGKQKYQRQACILIEALHFNVWFSFNSFPTQSTPTGGCVGQSLAHCHQAASRDVFWPFYFGLHFISPVF